MHIELLHRPANSIAHLTFSQGESMTTEAGAMVAMSQNLEVETSTHKKGQGGVLKALKRMISGESFFMNHYTASKDGAELWLAPPLSGDICKLDLQGQRLIVQSGSFMAASPDIDVGMGWQGFQSMLSGEGLFWLSLSGRGQLLLSSFGAIYAVHVDGEHVVDTGHIVAFDETLNFSISKAGTSWLHSFIGGEGLVCRFKGQGTIWCQSHSPAAFGQALSPVLRARS